MTPGASTAALVVQWILQVLQVTQLHGIRLIEVRVVSYLFREEKQYPPSLGGTSLFRKLSQVSELGKGSQKVLMFCVFWATSARGWLQRSVRTCWNSIGFCMYVLPSRPTDLESTPDSIMTCCAFSAAISMLPLEFDTAVVNSTPQNGQNHGGNRSISLVPPLALFGLSTTSFPRLIHRSQKPSARYVKHYYPREPPTPPEPFDWTGMMLPSCSRHKSHRAQMCHGQYP